MGSSKGRNYYPYQAPKPKLHKILSLIKPYIINNISE